VALLAGVIGFAGPCRWDGAVQTMTSHYLLISPCRDEAEHCRRTLDSVIAQTVRPDLWVIVDDGSTDDTPAILADYARRHPFLRVVRRGDRGARSVGPGVVDAFYAGYGSVRIEDFDYLCKLDLDLELPSVYFETLLRRMADEPAIGTCSGKPYFRTRSGRWVSEAIGDEMSAGMAKLYRRECFAEIGGFVREVMWDGIDCHRCRMLGWIACSWDDPELRFTHLRPMGSSDKSTWRGRLRHGRGQWFMGTGVAYMCASALFRMTRRPFLFGGLGMLAGYLGALLQRRPRYHDPGFRRFLRRYQRDCLLLGKRRATARLHAACRRPADPRRTLPAGGP
jgi:glycosyltransferase involved in cell wall biosynthesis